MINHSIETRSFYWVLQNLCAIHRKPHSAALLRQQCPAPHDLDGLLAALGEAGFAAEAFEVRARAMRRLAQELFPLIVLLRGAEAGAPLQPALLLQADEDGCWLAQADGGAPRHLPYAELQASGIGAHIRVALQPAADGDPDAVPAAQRRFGFRWFVPELLRHRRFWVEILLASLALQLIALATPLMTQAVIDKVVVHRTESTLQVIAAGMAIFVVFTALLGWMRQYLVLHIGNRVDATLGAAVMAHLFRLPPAWFQPRATGVIATRLQGVETIREFLAGATATLVLDLPFLLVFVAAMFYYSVPLTLLVLAVLGAIGVMSLLVAPLFQERLQQQFQWGARTQAFVTEYVAGIETVKALQLEPQLTSRFRATLAGQLAAGFSTRQLANTYNSAANLLEQLLNLGILALGAWTVIQHADFTVGMLVAFQMFASRLSQPLLRLVGLWQQFQQARLAVLRLGDVMNVLAEPYALLPTRATAQHGALRIENLAFRYGAHLPLLYERLNLTIEPGQAIALMGPSGCGKSTLARLLLGFHQPVAGRITLDGQDIAYLPVNELRSHFGVVPQETVLFAGTLYDNLLVARPAASFEQIVGACRMAGIHEVIDALPHGYQTEVGERGAGLSGGQRQRIAIARALLKRAPVLIFDEATSALDAETAEQFAATINTLRGKVSMLFIAHSLPPGLRVDATYRLGASGLCELPSVALRPARAS